MFTYEYYAYITDMVKDSNNSSTWVLNNYYKLSMNSLSKFENDIRVKIYSSSILDEKQHLLISVWSKNLQNKSRRYI